MKHGVLIRLRRTKENKTLPKAPRRLFVVSALTPVAATSVLLMLTFTDLGCTRPVGAGVNGFPTDVVVDVVVVVVLVLVVVLKVTPHWPMQSG